LRTLGRFAAAVGLALVAACGRESPAPAGAGSELETVDVSAAPDATATLENDPVDHPAPSGRGGVAGVLPGDFPRDVPLPQPSSLVDFGKGWIELDVVGTLEGVQTAYLRQLADAGFAVRDGGVWQRGTRRLRVDFRAAGPATRVRLEPLAGS